MSARLGMTPLPRVAEAEHLTEALRRSGAVGTARVGNVAVTSSLKKLNSHTLRLRLHYEVANEPPRKNTNYLGF